MSVKQEKLQVWIALERKKGKRLKRVRTMEPGRVRVGLLGKLRDPTQVMKHQPRAVVTP